MSRRPPQNSRQPPPPQVVPPEQSRPEPLYPCRSCERHFTKDALVRHEPICQKSAKKQRKEFNSMKQRLAGTGISVAQAQRSVTKPEKPKKNVWRQQHQNFIQSVRAAKMASQAEKSGQPIPAAVLATLNTPTQHDDYVACPHCGRKFAPHAADRHISFCEKQKSRISGPGNSRETNAARQQARVGYKPPPPPQKAPAPMQAPVGRGPGAPAPMGGTMQMRGPAGPAAQPGRIPLQNSSLGSTNASASPSSGIGSREPSSQGYGGMKKGPGPSPGPGGYSANAGQRPTPANQRPSQGVSAGARPAAGPAQNGYANGADGSYSAQMSATRAPPGNGQPFAGPPGPGRMPQSSSMGAIAQGQGGASAPARRQMQPPGQARPGPGPAQGGGGGKAGGGAKFCHECGSSFDSNVKFCTECGAKRLFIG